jgi:tetratricopeptide (TPR) repeat protein
MEQTICNECQTQNPAANAFCTACGHKLQPILVRDVGDSLQEGYRLVSEGRPDQALLIASAVLRKQPEESGAYALMAMAHEEKGDIPEAIRCYEEVVRLRPESKIDAIKLSQLKEQAQTPSAAVRGAKRGLAMALSVGAALLAVAVGLAFAWPRGDEPEKQPDTTLLADNSARGFKVPDQGMTQPSATGENPAAQAPPTAEPHNNVSPPSPTSGGQPTGRVNRAVLPPAGPSSAVRNPGQSNQPLRVEITPEQLPKTAATTPPSSTEPPAAKPGDENVIEKRPGQINISESRRGNPTDPNVSENTYRIAQDKMKAGDYRGAIRDFQAALSGSDKKALIHQLIGRCYTRLGDKSSAKQHFEAALSMYEAAGAKSAADAVRREIGLLG